MASTALEIWPHNWPSLPLRESVEGRLAGAVERAAMRFAAVTVFEPLSSQVERDIQRACDCDNSACAPVSNATGAEKTLAGETL